MISENKIKHSLGVARKCEELAKERQMTLEEQKACFVMGFLHDIGYEVDGDITEHPNESANYISAFISHKDLCLDAIESHGSVKSRYTIYDYILNSADLTVNYKGDNVSVERRLEDIKGRHGEESSHYQHAVETALNYNLI